VSRLSIFSQAGLVTLASAAVQRFAEGTHAHTLLLLHMPHTFNTQMVCNTSDTIFAQADSAGCAPRSTRGSKGLLHCKGCLR